ncbi:hypothetical protein [Clavibacter michiganensis]|uniref:Uncharacterized protein n=1 Tax=Clavibacter michiganensis subsp. insidiosus TaxID=33014 RepID=A0A0D5CIL4_9MICO|nr:hypothetical protein [Clavibacter michiganensis]AJW79493.1 hypothetical protein VO01_10410 [Clavibacter michiganensis subsp. insidiosus]AWF97756.1 hypothetical protein BEH61_04480 [Clavibacter michiganensis subsp. insidiosus]AWG02044.1 hypothetical protein BEH62_10595 [Clavibacter michiganensis subsp. insidiosus]OQJ59469.1 hypothetical protein B5P21_05810 [Clavibacter michiganensis subsp. insidiosus]RII88520.1 hypothetical protein DZF92_02720 [Clavibacter michiganensis subsp. insidiosus]
MRGADLALRLATAVTTTPSPTPTAEFDPDTVSPGPIGFIAIFFVAVVVLLLMVDMTRRIRRTRYREEIRGRLEAEKLEADLARDAAPERDIRMPGPTAADDDGTADPDDPAGPPRG